MSNSFVTTLKVAAAGISLFVVGTVGYGSYVIFSETDWDAHMAEKRQQNEQAYQERLEEKNLAEEASDSNYVFTPTGRVDLENGLTLKTGMGSGIGF